MATKSSAMLVRESNSLATEIGATGTIELQTSANAVLRTFALTSTPFGTPNETTGVMTVNGLPITGTGTSVGLAAKLVLKSSAGAIQVTTVVGANYVFTVDTGTDVFTALNHNFSNGDIVQVSTTTTLPSPLVAATDYKVGDVSGNTFKLYTVATNTVINVTDTGTGTHRIRNVVAEWLLNTNEANPLSVTATTGIAIDNLSYDPEA